MASNPPSHCCAQGFKHEGTPTGSFISIGDNSTYVTGDKSSPKVIFFLTDVFGNKFINNQLLADSFGRKGYYVVVPDICNGDQVDINTGLPAGWLDNHQPQQTLPTVRKTLEYVKQEIKPKFIATVGYCFGARYASILLGDEDSVDVGALAHPSFVQLEDIEKIKKPVIITAAETDPIYTPELREKTEEKLKEIKATYFTTLASGIAHGFAVRNDPSDKWGWMLAEKAFNDKVWWFQQFE